MAGNGYPAPQGIRRTKGEPCSAKQGNSPTLQGSKTSEPRHLVGVQLDVTMLSEHQDLADAHSGCVTGRVWASEATVAPVIGRPSAVQATGVHVATVGPEACLVQSETGQSVVPGRGKVSTSHLIARWLGLGGARLNRQKDGILIS